MLPTEYFDLAHIRIVCANAIPNSWTINEIWDDIREYGLGSNLRQETSLAGAAPRQAFGADSDT